MLKTDYIVKRSGCDALTKDKISESNTEHIKFYQSGFD
ncbi:MAG: hypothetical protein AVDCRST_MAG74-466 [uncultured Pyrinomonadaceae bacterium]|uniref:Uncharacterized protein n=1 Tax=uncultured Pyrinomonadaceae bacterium TaxID=2283094 RepID=A0A6J4NCJ8_9BACT|nr:MAG: hypothetical protein AVDCRST_MAG74-466 [uncultured Pyrinomonadaceae bacterium]